MNSDDPLPFGRNILEAVKTRYPTLRKSDRKVADVLLENPQRLMNATVAETAELAGVSQPTVIRFCSAIGCEGFQDLKLRLAQSLALGTPATNSAIDDADTPQEVASKIFDYTISSLDWARHALDMEQVNAAVEIILDSTHIEFFGFGASAIVAQDLQQKFPLFGIPCNATMDSHQQLMAASMMRPGSVAVAISNTGATLTIIELARLARDRGAKVIAMTGGTQTTLLDYSDVVINVEALDNTELFTPTTSRIAALCVADILSTLVARRLGQAHNQRLVRMKRFLSQMRRNQPF
ncbi:RpiR family transcriptional regulator [Palleronia aestuarii]|uniref:RpiR family transcriptional regulator n=1 Tax=Palleronia aestuarii TaxID=568105 RepID=A0A2W7MX32_9RHOB|nr:MurR/RpiR family transcriptional regulator [Palleronia aestuarii]PZX12201.1 RpiR family transcriptional regulator [Palleronia aestuarii]